jgi:hypothetical protein
MGASLRTAPWPLDTSGWSAQQAFMVCRQIAPAVNRKACGRAPTFCAPIARALCCLAHPLPFAKRHQRIRPIAHATLVSIILVVGLARPVIHRRKRDGPQCRRSAHYVIRPRIRRCLRKSTRPTHLSSRAVLRRTWRSLTYVCWVPSDHLQTTDACHRPDGAQP